jgi:hypothetical protein
VSFYYARDLLKNAAFLPRFPICRGLLPIITKGHMICSGLFEENDVAMACFCGGLNHKIHDILDGEYAYMNSLFEYACKAKREVQGHRSKTYSNSFAGRSSTSNSAPAHPAPSTPTTTPHKRMAKPAGASACANSEPLLQNAPNIPTENIGNAHGATLTEGDNCVNVLNFIQIML